MLNLFKTLMVTMLGVFSLSGHSATIAVIDSGVDVEHRDFVDKIWMNEKEVADSGRDEDRNGYPDDVYGWNFAEGNNQVIDRSYLGTFSDDPKKFFEVQKRMLLGEASNEDMEWLASKRQDAKFAKEMNIFGNFIHGTHVAGISQNKNIEAKVLSVKLIPTEVKLPTPSASEEDELNSDEEVKNPYAHLPENLRMMLLINALEQLAKQQMNGLEEIAVYVGNHGADVANGSFGTGFEHAKMITDNAFKVFFFRAPSQEESDLVAKGFLNALLTHGKSMVAAAPKTLFVFAAGNDSSNNDIYPTSPTNIDAQNVISVAATYKRILLAPFSNYGVDTVDVAAPGMLVRAQIPGDDYLDVSGTSQAAPYVSNVAAQMKDINPALTPAQLKTIIMSTVDKKSWLADKVKSAGIVNSERAFMAAKLTLTKSVADAISLASSQVSDVKSVLPKSKINPFSVTPIAMPSGFIIK